jgi:predicted NBD/HSP70 family sugar kinase
MVLISVGSGLGCGLILDGQLYHGADGAAGEFGHTILVPGGLTCSCGAHGCLEMYCSGRALSHAAVELFGQEAVDRVVRGANGLSSGAQLLIEQARAGNEAAHDALDEAFAYLGEGISSLVNLLNPRRIVLEGDLVLAWPECLETVREVVSEQALASAQDDLAIERSRLAPYGAVLGGAALVTRALKNT